MCQHTHGGAIKRPLVISRLKMETGHKKLLFDIWELIIILGLGWISVVSTPLILTKSRLRPIICITSNGLPGLCFVLSARICWGFGATSSPDRQLMVPAASASRTSLGPPNSSETNSSYPLGAPTFRLFDIFGIHRGYSRLQ